MMTASALIAGVEPCRTRPASTVVSVLSERMAKVVVVVLERGQERQYRRREQSRLQERQQDVEEHLRVGCAEIERRLLLRAVEALQPGEDDQHAEGRDEAATGRARSG